MIKEYRKLDFSIKTYITSSLSLLMTVIFSLFNLILFILHKTYYSLGISIYYILLTLLRLIILYNIYNKKNNINSVYNKTKVLFSLLNIFMLIPIVLMVLNRKNVFIECESLAISLALYTTIRITLSIINYVKTKKIDNILIKELRHINLIDSLLALLVLEHTMLFVFQDPNEDFILLRIISSVVIYTLIIISEIINFIKYNKTIN